MYQRMLRPTDDSTTRKTAPRISIHIVPGRVVPRSLDNVQVMILGQHEQERWDAFVAQAPNGHLLQCWGWGELKRAFGWEPLRIALWDPATYRLLAGAQVLLRPIPLTGSAFAYLPKGPVLDWSDEALSGRFFAALHAQLKQKRVALLRLEPDLPEWISAASEHAEETPARRAGARDLAMSIGERYSLAQGREVLRRLAEMGFCPISDRIQPRRTLVVDLAADEQVLLQRQKPRWRYNVQLAARKGITIRPAHSLDDVRAWYDVLGVTRERNHFVGHPFAYYRRAWELLAPRQQARLFLAEHEGKLLAGAFVTLVGHQAVYLYGASGNEDRQLKPNYLLQWEAMRWAKSQGATFYDQWGIAPTDDPADPQAGLTAFKRGWGGQVIEFVSGFDYVYAPLAARIFLGATGLKPLLITLRAGRRKR